MLRKMLLPISIAIAIVAPAMAHSADPEDPVITEANRDKARSEARKARSDALKAEADARYAPLQRFAGTGETTIGTGGGDMESAYLSAVALRNVAVAIDRRVDSLLGSTAPARAAGDGPAASRVILLAASDTFSFDRLAAFETESSELVGAFNRALQAAGGRTPQSCGASQGSDGFRSPGFSGAIATAGALLNLVQGDLEVRGFTETGGDTMLMRALAEANPNRYVLHTALIEPPRLADEPSVRDPLVAIEACEDAARQRARARGLAANHKARLEALVTRATGFRDRLSTPAADGGSIPIATILRQSNLRRNSPFVLRVQVQRRGGTMLIRKNLWTALGAPAVVLSGGVIADFELTERSTGWMRGGRVDCRTDLTGLRNAIRLQGGDIVCADGPPERRPRQSRTARRDRLSYDASVFRSQEP